jgi:hypothetical protein
MLMTGHACTHCGEPFSDGDQVSFGTSNGIGECVGLCCLESLESLYAAKVYGQGDWKVSERPPSPYEPLSVFAAANRQVPEKR